jgi:hypothetical protein
MMYGSAVHRFRVRPLWVALAAPWLLWSQRAQAFERQWHAGLDAGFAELARIDKSAGIGGGGHLAYGLSDAFNALFEVDVTRQFDAHTTVASAAVGAAYTLDVTRLVPYGGVLIGGYHLFADLPANALGVQGALGLDYGISRSWAVGLQVRFHKSLWTWSDAPGGFSYTTAFVRAEYVWGF